MPTSSNGPQTESAAKPPRVRRVTRDIHPDKVRDLLERVPRACICFATASGPLAHPIHLKLHGSIYLIRIWNDIQVQPPINQEVAVLVDEGIHWFDLRAVYVRGRIKPAEETEADTSLAGKWFELVPTKTTAWDYGTLREA